MLKNPLAISLMLLSCLIALAFAKGKSLSSEQAKNMQMHRTAASVAPATAVRPGSLQSAN
jgi:hypothetical protein